MEAVKDANFFDQKLISLFIKSTVPATLDVMPDHMFSATYVKTFQFKIVFYSNYSIFTQKTQTRSISSMFSSVIVTLFYYQCFDKQTKTKKERICRFDCRTTNQSTNKIISNKMDIYE